MKVNLHSHTFRCGHCDGTEREFVEKAIKNGFTALGFSDHAPHILPDGSVSGFRMHYTRIEDYCETVRALKEEYKKDIDIYLGFEVEYYPAVYDAFLERIRPYDVDYLIQGQHFTNNEIDGFGVCTTLEDDQIELFASHIYRGLKTGTISYVAHPDMPSAAGGFDVYRRAMMPALELCRRHDIPMEINLLGLWDGRQYPKEDMIALCGELGVPMIIGVDAHQPFRFDDEATREKALAMAQKHNVRLVDMPHLRRPNEAKPLE